MKPQRILLSSLDRVIEERKPLGLFYSWDAKRSCYIACDNSRGDAFTEAYTTVDDCLTFLRGEKQGYFIEHTGDYYQSVFPENEADCSYTHTTLDDAFEYMVNTCNIEPHQIKVMNLNPEIFNSCSK